ncbi:hypothetical protein [Snodgrassella sp. ESL0253]|uniref:hypothetical protein n=1 Tax=Snodgrassella sp. ESL0253 TaxID=2705031 RepID=UPI0015817730|nr:hypothetical protein [Snodgrassella sp. ESL0253]NUE67707.1 hypothetical protein [Snodgrassella sp. ESL0253]
MSIKLNYPIDIIFEELEFDDCLPSIKFRVDVNVNKFNYKFNYSGELLIDCSVLDSFIKNLNKGKSSILNDMNKKFFIRINKTSECIKLIWLVKRQDIQGFLMKSGYKCVITEDECSLIRKEFNNYSKWW